MRKFTYLIMMIAAVAIPIFCFVRWYNSREVLPRVTRIAAGKSGGLYDAFAQNYAKPLHEQTGRPVSVIETDGSRENVELVRSGDAELGVMQAGSSTPADIRVVAPLFPEPVLLLVRKDGEIRSISDLVGRRVLLGPPGSGSRQCAETVLNHYQIPSECIPNKDKNRYFGDLETEQDLDAALFTTGYMNPTLQRLMLCDDLELIEIADAEGLAARYPWFTVTTIPKGLYPGKPPAPLQPVTTVAVVAQLVVRADASDRFVRGTLAARYDDGLRASFPELLTQKEARDYDAAVMHPSVASYHDPYSSLNSLASALELVGNVTEVLLALSPIMVLIWGLSRRRRKRAQATADQIQKEKLDEFIAETLNVELQQMEVTDSEALRPFLRRVTQIKQEALRNLTSEKVRGDQLFAIFLSQCAALSEKIQMRMLYGKMSE